MIIDELIERAFCEGYEYALEEREFSIKSFLRNAKNHGGIFYQMSRDKASQKLKKANELINSAYKNAKESIKVKKSSGEYPDGSYFTPNVDFDGYNKKSNFKEKKKYSREVFPIVLSPEEKEAVQEVENKIKEPIRKRLLKNRNKNLDSIKDGIKNYYRV